MELGIILAALIGAGAGAGGVFVINQRKGVDANAKAEKLLTEARDKAKSLELEAKDKALDITNEATKELKKRQGDLAATETRLAERETTLDKKLEELDGRSERLRKDESEVEGLKNEIRDIRGKQLEKLEKIAGLSKKEAGEKLMQMTEKDLSQDLIGC
jgi:ribonucrease Y